MVLVPASAVGAAGVPVKVGEASGAYVEVMTLPLASFYALTALSAVNAERARAEVTAYEAVKALCA